PTPITSFFQRSPHHRALHSFPTRRSSDLDRADVGDLPIRDVVLKKGLDRTATMSTLRRYELDRVAGNPYQVLSGGQQARFQIMRSEEHTSDSSHVAISYAVFCLKKKKK